MPWSEWIDDGYDQYGFKRSAWLAEKPIDAPPLPPTSLGTGASAAHSLWGNVDGAGVTGHEDIAVFKIDPGYTTAFDWFPYALWDLTEDVDYAVRPDRTGSEDDAYVEFEPGGVCAHTSWVIASMAGSWQSGQVSADVVPEPDSPGRVAYEGTDYTTGGWPAYLSGATLINLSLTYSPTSGAATFAVPSTTVAPSSALSVFVKDQLYDPPPTPPPGKAMARHVDIGSLNATPRGTMPRYRYWIPGPDVPLPLRQRQRDDGLGMSGTPRWRHGRSRQASSRWRGYL